MSYLPPDNEDADSENATGSNGGAKIFWFLLGMSPIPIGLLIGPANILDSRFFAFYVIATLLLGMISGAGLTGGFETRRLSAIGGGMFLGVWFAGFDLSVIFLAGCCASAGLLGNMH